MEVSDPGSGSGSGSWEDYLESLHLPRTSLPPQTSRSPPTLARQGQTPEIMSPSQVIAAGYASCTGLSIFLVDACRWGKGAGRGFAWVLVIYKCFLPEGTLLLPEETSSDWFQLSCLVPPGVQPLNRK